MSVQAEPIRNSQNEYSRRNKGFAGITCFWTQGSASNAIEGDLTFSASMAI